MTSVTHLEYATISQAGTKLHIPITYSLDEQSGPKLLGTPGWRVSAYIKADLIRFRTYSTFN